MAIREMISALVVGQDLSQDQAVAAMTEIMDGTATAGQIAAFLTALRLKGETVDELTGMALVMRERAMPVPFEKPLLDTCGTGGDGAGTFNISTIAAFVAAGAGATVAKHGNRAVSGVCGSADLLEGLGVRIDLEPEGVIHCLNEAGMGFMFAPKFHPAMRYAGPVRREIGIRTAFNVLGPLTNPAHARHQVLGVADPLVAEKLAHTISRMGTVHALVVHGDGAVDELTLSGPSIVWDVRSGQEPQRLIVDPKELRLTLAPREAVSGGGVAENVAICRSILSGDEHGPRRDIVLLNAAAALVAADCARNLAEGLAQARTSLDQGYAAECLDRLIAASNS